MANDVDSSVQRSGKEAGRVKWIKKTATKFPVLQQQKIREKNNRWNKSCEYFNFKVNFCKQQQQNLYLFIHCVTEIVLWILNFRLLVCFFCAAWFWDKELLPLVNFSQDYKLFCLCVFVCWSFMRNHWNMVWNCLIRRISTLQIKIKIKFITTGNNFACNTKNHSLIPVY